MQNIDKTQLRNLIIGTLSILSIYGFNGVVHEKLIVVPYVSSKTGESQVIKEKSIIVLAPTLITWLIGNLYNRFMLEDRTIIPEKKSFVCGLIIFISTITYTYASAMTSFPVVMAFKACNILSILVVAISCTRVKEKHLKLGPKKLIVGSFVALGVFLFSFFDPEQKDRTTQSQYLGIFFLVVSLIADGFLPDFQAEIKSQFKPQPTQMMEHINKWVAIISVISMLASFQIKQTVTFTVEHPRFALDLVFLGILSCAGQFVVYTMIKLFKQHIVPFIITTRKLLTVVISVMWFKHKTSPIQLFGMIIVFLSVVYEFATEVKKQPQTNKMEIQSTSMMAQAIPSEDRFQKN